MLEIRELRKSYGGRQVLSPVSFLLPPGQCLGLAGHTGSGKSTLLRLIAQIEKPEGGDILFEGKSVLGDRTFPRKALGYVPQGPELDRELTVKQQLALWQAACGLSGPLALGLLSRPQSLLMDEATSGLDRDYVPRLLDWLEGYTAQGGSLIWCSHHREELDRLCGAVLTLENGTLV